MRLVAISLVRNEEYWIWYALTSVYPYVDRILLFDNHSTDATLEIVRGMRHVADKLSITERFGGSSEHENREHCLDAARAAGGTHVLFLDGDEVHIGADLGFARRLLEAHEHTPGLADPPHNATPPGDPTPTNGVLIKNIGFKPIHPGFAGPCSSIPRDFSQPDTDHSCYNFAIRICSLANLTGNGEEWGRHGYRETGGAYIQSSPHTLWCPKLHYFHMTLHPRSPSGSADVGSWRRPVEDHGSKPLPAHVEIPEVLTRADGPGNPTLARWGMAGPRLLAPSPEPVPGRSG